MACVTLRTRYKESISMTWKALFFFCVGVLGRRREGGEGGEGGGEGVRLNRFNVVGYHCSS